jgi:hypothetical protein
VEEPQEVPADEEHERIWERAAAIDTARASGVVCTRLPDEDRPGRRRTHVRTAQATAGAVIELGDCLRARQVQVLTVESTSGYRPIWFVLLQAAGLGGRWSARGRSTTRRAGPGPARRMRRGGPS